MADKKITQLPTSTVPLAGTEVLPIVQGTTPTTKQVSVADLTAGRAISATQYTSTIATGTPPLVVASTTEVANLKAATATLADSATTTNAVKSNATTGVLQITGPATASTRVMTTPDANFTVARTDAANSFTADQTLATGNLVIGTSGKGIDFSATPQPAGMTSELLADYEEGTWTPTFTTDGTDFTSVTYDSIAVGYYTKVGRLVMCNGSMRTSGITVGSASGNLQIAGLPYTVTNKTVPPFANVAGAQDSWASAAPTVIIPVANGTKCYLYYIASGATATSVVPYTALGGGTNNNQVFFTIFYFTD